MTVRQVTDNPSDGYNFGASATEKVSLWGVTPIVQPAATAQSAVATTAITTATSTTITSVASTSLTALDVTRLNALIQRVEDIRVVTDALVTRAEAMRALQAQTRTDLIAIGAQKGSA